MERAAIITINYNQNQYTADCIKSILKSDYPDFRIVVIDNEAVKGNSIVLKRLLPDSPRISIYAMYPNLGYVGGINYALSLLDKQADYEYILIMNNDTIIDSNAISALVKTCREYNDKALVTGKVYDFEKKDLLQDTGAVIEDPEILKFRHISTNVIDKGQFDQVAERDMIDDVFWLMPKALYKEIGGYNPLFYFNGESADFAMRARYAGYKLIYTPDAKLWHKGSASTGGRKENPFVNYWQMRSTLTFRYLHLKPACFRRFVLVKIKQVIFGYLKYGKLLISGKKQSFRVPIARMKGFMDFFLKVRPSVSKAKRHAVQDL